MLDTHPTPEILTAFAQGRLEPALAEPLEEHLATCDACGEYLAGAHLDTFSALLRDTTATGVQVLPPRGHPLAGHPKFEVHETLGQGGMGTVVRATHRVMHREVALKVIRADLLAAPQAVARFRREVQLAAKLAHPNIVTAYDAEEFEGQHLLVMEYVKGRTLDVLVRGKGPLDVKVALHIARQIALGLDHAHTHGMTHRDIKPHNVIVTREGKAKILDFGLATWADPREAASGMTTEGKGLGTMLYAAPEQLKGQSDARSDLYGLGATLYFLLTGEPPLKRVNGITSIPEDVPERVAGIIRTLMAADPADRYPSAKAAADALVMPEETAQQPKRRYSKLEVPALVLALGLVLAFLFNRGNQTPASLSGSAAVVTKQELWQPLSPAIDPKSHAVVGTWKKTADGVRVAAAAGTRLMLPVTPARQYDLRFRFVRNSGMHSVGAVLAVGGTQCTFEVDAWGQNLAGFQKINGKDCRDNPTRREGYRIVNGKPYELLLEVRNDSVRAVLNGSEVVRYITNGKDLGLDSNFWNLPDPNAIGLVAYESDVTFSNVEYRVFP